MIKLTQEQEQIVGTEKYKLYLRRGSQATESHIAYGKWLIATLITVHGGALIAISQLGPRAKDVFVLAGAWFLAGLMLALATGFLAWLNFQFAEKSYDAISEPAMMFSIKFLPDVIPHSKKIRLTLYAAASVGILSWLCIPIGAYSAFPAFLIQQPSPC